MRLPFAYLVERAARRSGAPPWVMWKRPLYDMGLALACERIDARAEEIARRIQERRAKGAKGGEEDEDSEE